MFRARSVSIFLTLSLVVPAGAPMCPAASALEGVALTAWQEDISVLLQQFPEREKGLTPETRAEFMKRIEALQSRLSELDEQHVAIAIMQAVAIAGNAHTAARPKLADLKYTRVPVRLHSFSDGIYVVKARPEHEQLVGGRVVSIGGRHIDDVMTAVGSLFYGNVSWKRYTGVGLITIPGVLFGLDLITNPAEFELEVESAEGVIAKNTLVAEKKVAPENAEDWWDLAPTKQRVDPDWVFAFDAGKTPVPLYLKEPNIVFWTEYLPSSKALYVQYNSSTNQAGATAKDNVAKVLEALRGNNVERVVIDLRFNTGGNLMLMRGAFGRILREDLFQRAGSLYVITGASTFSAGLFHAANLKQEGRAIVVGDLAGDDLDFWAEGGRWMLLPNSKMGVGTQSGFHSYSKIERPDLAEHLYLDLSLDTLEPDLPAPMTFADYIAGRDPSLDAALSN